MYERIFDMKFLPPGRGLWAMGTPITEERMMFAALNNCAFVSTQNLKEEGSKPFTFLMDAAMLGVGVGFDTLGAGMLCRVTRVLDLPKQRSACPPRFLQLHLRYILCLFTIMAVLMCIVLACRLHERESSKHALPSALPHPRLA